MKFKAIVFFLIATFCITFTAFYGKEKISEKKEFTYPAEFKGILTLWHIDSFEGGMGSRKQFLMSVAREFEKQNEGVLFMIISHTEKSAENALLSGEKPDLVSFGCGVEVKNAKIFGDSVTKLAQSFEKENAFGGRVGSGVYAMPWAKGCYTLIANDKLVSEIPKSVDTLLVSQGEFTQPLSALALDGFSVGEVTVTSPMEAYVKFTENKTPYFLGTQRDVNRLLSRGATFISLPLTNFNDLYQYVSVTSIDAQKSVIAERFVEYLLSEKVQKSLNNISLFSPYFSVEYDNETLAVMQNAKSKNTLSAFLAKESLEELQRISALYYSGDQTALTKLKNFIL